MEMEGGRLQEKGNRRAQKEMRAAPEEDGAATPGWGAKGAGSSCCSTSVSQEPSWERDGSGKVWECSWAGTSAEQRQAARGLGGVCEAGTGTHWGRNERESGS